MIGAPFSGGCAEDVRLVVTGADDEVGIGYLWSDFGELVVTLRQESP